MESLAALSLAGTVVQFIEFATKVAKGSHEIFQSAEGLTIEHTQFQVLTEDLQGICDELQKPIPEDQVTSQGEKRLQNFAEECTVECKRLQNVLNELKVKEGGKRWKGFVAAVKAIGKEKAILEIQNNLEAFKSTICLQLAQILESKQSNVQKTIREMEESNKQLDAQRTSQIAEVITKLDHIRNFGASKDDFEHLYSNLVHIITTGRSVAIEQKVLQSLIFPQMRFRHERIPESHRRTFDWIFESESGTGDQAHQRPKVHFMEWLRSSESEQSVYWLGGKAGSGKSTLMKYICSHSQVQAELQTWSGDDALVVASFFFWRSGTELQKSQEGLLRSLLFEVLRRCPSIISKVIEIKWTYAVRDPWLRPKEQEPWTKYEMMQVFNLLEDEHIESKFCFFIDGLDEYNGEPSDLIEVVQKLARLSNIKLCVSSRPWTDFKSAFDIQGLALHLHELTRNDIRIYVHDKLEQHDRFIQEGSKDSAYQELVTEIVDRAHGVFLWVSLVVKSLLKGLAHADTVQMLQHRLSLLPSDLEELFSLMLKSVDSIYESQMGRTFLVAMAANGPLPLIIYHSLDDLETVEDFALREKVYTQEEWNVDGDNLTGHAKHLISAKEREMRVRLEARSRGLLEVSTDSSSSIDAASLKVEFLHRTVRDYLEKSDISEDLVRRANKAKKLCGQFIPEVALCHCFLAGIKMLPRGEPESGYANKIADFVNELLWYAHRAEISAKTAQKDVLDELYKTLSIMYPPENSLSLDEQSLPPFQPLHPKLLERFNCISLIELCVQRGLLKYCSLKVSPELVAGRFKKPLLFHSLYPTMFLSYGHAVTYEMALLLLENGANPNAVVESSDSIWSAFLKHQIVHSFDGLALKNCTIPDIEVVDGMLRAGADANIKLGGLAVFGAIVHDYFTDDPQNRRIRLLRSFAQHGASPNAQWKKGTIWQERLQYLYNARMKIVPSEYFEEVKLLLQAKAGLEVWVWKERVWYTTPSQWTYTNSKGLKSSREIYQTGRDTIKALFSPQEAAELLQIAHKMEGNKLLAHLRRSFYRVFQHPR